MMTYTSKTSLCVQLQLLQLSAVVNHGSADKYKGKCVNKVLHFLRCTSCTANGGEKHYCQAAVIFCGMFVYFSFQSVGVYDSAIAGFSLLCLFCHYCVL